jgi:RimK family alpha-L-glutamate ligase
MGVVAVLGSPENETSRTLVRVWRALGLDARLVPGHDAVALGPGDVAVGRLDVLPSLAGVEPGLLALLLLERRGLPVLNRAAGLLACHDKLRTARLLEAAGLPHPATAWVRHPDEPFRARGELVVKPRFGSWGRDVHRCETVAEARLLLRELADRPWFRRHGALVQELVPGVGRDLRVLVAGGRAVGAAERTAAAEEWRTNVSLGGTKAHADAPAAARTLAVAAAAAVGCDLTAVDLLPLEAGGHVILELNAAADFDEVYSWPARDVYEDVAQALALLPSCTASACAAAV